MRVLSAALDRANVLREGSNTLGTPRNTEESVPTERKRGTETAWRRHGESWARPQRGRGGDALSYHSVSHPDLLLKPAPTHTQARLEITLWGWGGKRVKEKQDV